MPETPATISIGAVWVRTNTRNSMLELLVESLGEWRLLASWDFTRINGAPPGFFEKPYVLMEPFGILTAPVDKDPEFELERFKRLQPGFKGTPEIMIGELVHMCSQLPFKIQSDCTHHLWKAPVDSQFENEVRCVHCGMPGEVYYPCT